MSAEIVSFPGVSRLDTPPDRVLNGALEADLDKAVVIGWTKEGEFFFASSYAAGPETLWLLHLASKKLLEIGDPE